ncbi:MAG: hypothetical protein PHZ23_15890 [Acidiphilium sp.]|nr:hypothetical protein [Acidiphilium sp.]
MTGGDHMTLKTALAAFGAYLERNGFQFDRSVNTLTGGNPDQTVSMRAAIGAGYGPGGKIAPGKPGWCLFCRFLNLVQRNHCALQFSAARSPAVVYIRAGIAFATGFIALFGISHLLFDAVQYLV